MRKLVSMFLLTLGLFSCVNDKDLYEDHGGASYAGSFSNVKTVNVNISSPYNTAYYSVFYEYPYADGDLVKTPALTGVTPINTTLDVPNDVKKLYVLGDGTLRTFNVGNVEISTTRSIVTTNAIDAKVMEYINGSCFPEASYNVRKLDLFKCTDLVIASSPETGEFDKAEVWVTYLNDGGFYIAGGYGYLWFYTYPTEKLGPSMTVKDLTFYGMNAATQEIIQVSYDTDIANGNKRKNPLFYSKNEQVDGVSSFKKIKLGEFEKGLNIGFVYYGTGVARFSTPYLNTEIVNKTLKYGAPDGNYIVNGKVSNGFMRHIKIEDSKGKTFEGNVLGMENRAPGESAYDGDYNDMLLLVESNPLALKPQEEIDDAPKIESRRSQGVYLFEDNYPARGDYDFNDVVVEYDIVDFYKSANKAKQVAARLLANGCGFTNTFGFKQGNTYIPYITDVVGYRNVSGAALEPFGEWISQVLYGDILPYLENGNGKIVDPLTYNTGEYPYVLDIPHATSDFMFRWCQEKKPINEAYNFVDRAPDWYLTPADESKVVR